MNDSNLIEKYEMQLSSLIELMRHEGIREEIIHFILDQAARDSEMKIIAKGELE